METAFKNKIGKLKIKTLLRLIVNNSFLTFILNNFSYENPGCKLFFALFLNKYSCFLKKILRKCYRIGMSLSSPLLNRDLHSSNAFHRNHHYNVVTLEYKNTRDRVTRVTLINPSNYSYYIEGE